MTKNKIIIITENKILLLFKIIIIIETSNRHDNYRATIEQGFEKMCALYTKENEEKESHTRE